MDQFLEHLINIGIRKVIRIGGQSKSTLIQDHNLRNVGKEERKTRAESWMVRGKYEDLSESTKVAAQILNNLRGIRKSIDWKSLEQHLANRYSEIHAQFPRVDEDGYEYVGQHPFDIWRSTDISGTRIRQAAQQIGQTLGISGLLAKATANAYSLTHMERQRLIDHWVRELHDDEVDGLFQIVH